jgi:hypothetical protein
VTARLGLALVAFTLGFSLSRIGFSSWDQVHEMFVFTDLRMFLSFVLGVVVLAVAWQVVARVSPVRWAQRNIHQGTLAGGAIFGVGWALSGACPSIALVQLGEGQLGAIFTLGGIFAGNWLYSLVHERVFKWSMGSCLDD